MKNIIKSQLFQLKYERLYLIIMILVTVFITAIALLDNAMSVKALSIPLTGCMYFFNTVPNIISISILPALMLVGQMCCGDFTDKTTNYEIMSGHKRSEVFLGRAIPCVITCTICAVLVMAVPVVVLTIMNGWGDDIPLSHALVRILLIVVVIIRIICEYIFLSFLMKNTYIIMGLSYLFFALYLSGIFSDNLTPLLGITNLNMLFMIDSWTTYGLDYTVNQSFNAAIGPSQIISTLAVSLLVSAASLALGFVFFKNDDLN